MILKPARSPSWPSCLRGEQPHSRRVTSRSTPITIPTHGSQPSRTEHIGPQARYIRPMLRLTFVVLLAVLLIPGSRLHAQQEAAPKRERWQVTLEGERYVWDIGLVRLDGDSLVVRQ